MGSHGFAEVPDQALRTQSVYPEIVSEGLFGITQGWDVPVALWRAPNGFDAYYPGNAHNTLSFVLGGASVERLDGPYGGRRSHADQGSFMLYVDGDSRRYASRGDVRLCQIYFRFPLIRDIASAQDGASATGIELRDDRVFAHDLELRRIVDHYVARAADADDPPSLLEMDARAVLLGVHLLRHHSNRARPGRTTAPGLAPRRLAAVLDYIEAHLAEALSLAELAEVSGLSKRHFSGAFRQSTGMTPHQFLIHRRIHRARHLLAGPMPLVAIALECGFGSQQHFTTSFHRAVGTTPGAARAAMRL